MRKLSCYVCDACGKVIDASAPLITRRSKKGRELHYCSRPCFERKDK